MTASKFYWGGEAVFESTGGLVLSILPAVVYLDPFDWMCKHSEC